MVHKERTKSDFAPTLFEGIVKTFIMFVGEMEKQDLKWQSDENNSEIGVALANIIFVLFVFFFVVVVMNLLNAVAIGDIQV